MLEVLEIRRQEELESIRQEWTDLLERSTSASIFQTPEWLLTCQSFFGKDRLLTLAVRDNGKLVALAPMEIASMYHLPLRRLQFLGTGATDYLDFILDESVKGAALDLIFNYFINNRTRWDVLDLQQIPQESPTLTSWNAWLSGQRTTAEIMQQDTAGVYPNRFDNEGLVTELLEQEVCPYLPLPESWELFLAGLGKKTRWNIGYYERIARRDFDFSMGRLDADELGEGMTALFHLHTRRWRQRWLPGVLTGSRRQAFHREVAKQFLKKDWLRLYAIRLDGQIRAVLYCFSYRDRGYYYLGGFEPALSKYSLGTVLTACAIRDSIETGLREFDFLRGNEPYKARWTRKNRINYRALLLKRTLRSESAGRIVRLEGQVEHRYKEAMHKRFGGG